jgi:hypothetical protein
VLPHLDIEGPAVVPQAEVEIEVVPSERELVGIS